MLVLVALTLITVDARSGGHGFLNHVRGQASDVFSPLQRGTHAVLAPVGNFLTGALDYGSVRSENQRLRQQLAALQNQGVQSAASEQAAQQILKEAKIPFVGTIPGVTAEIIDNGSSNFDNSVTIDKGTSAGIADGQPVVAAGGLVGSVFSTSSHTATIRLLIDPSFAVGIALPGGNLATVQGQGSTEPLQGSVIAQTRGPLGAATQVAPPKVKVGEAVVTSGLKYESFPAGIPVGRVAKVDTPGGEAEPLLSIAPMVGLTAMSYVQVLLWSPQR